MEYIILLLALIAGFIIFMSIKKRQYDQTKKDPEKGGVDSDGGGGDGGGGEG